MGLKLSERSTSVIIVLPSIWALQSPRNPGITFQEWLWSDLSHLSFLFPGSSFRMLTQPAAPCQENFYVLVWFRYQFIAWHGRGSPLREAVWEAQLFKAVYVCVWWQGCFRFADTNNNLESSGKEQGPGAGEGPGVCLQVSGSAILPLQSLFSEMRLEIWSQHPYWLSSSEISLQQNVFL